ncbi:MAG: non-canonical purine NTP pyrophosphatase, partial [Armatimonadota bacterium]
MAGKLILATENEHKVREIRELLADLDVEVAHIGELDDPPELTETGDTFAENAREKALMCAVATGELSLADDSGLMV